MHVPLQTTIDGREEPTAAPQPVQSGPATDQPSLVRASLLARPDAPEPRR